MDVTVSVLVSCYFIAVFTTTECVVFEINDYDSNRVVLVDESDIVMTCSAPEFNNPQFEISHKSNIIIDSQDSFLITTLNKSIEVRITHVQAFHGGIYQCLVTGDGSMTLTNLTLDVRSGTNIYCPQSSETLNVNEGESLTLFCYFLWSLPSGEFTPYDYIWQKKIAPNPVLLATSTVTQSSGSVKGILIAVVGPFTADDDDTVYECSHPLRAIAGTISCSVGPVTVTPRPTNPTPQNPTQQPVTVPATSTPIRLSTKASSPSTITTYQKTLNVTIGPSKNTPTATPSPVQKDITEEPMTKSNKTPVVNISTIASIILSIVVIILAIVITVLLCHKSRFKRKERQEIKKRTVVNWTWGAGRPLTNQITK
ncbi:hypothetical protein BSL78_28551 [Apostichopus japonicus]|uniref:Ig-like domain-containing protein n=1 Tax=Stichopus japonicus TaxID=307972 RepID=A0A2G8JFW5_STIJA|nr:hypothetical protein BSL78_28551 [Apostichopus japonicus]